MEKTRLIKNEANRRVGVVFGALRAFARDENLQQVHKLYTLGDGKLYGAKCTFLTRIAKKNENRKVCRGSKINICAIATEKGKSIRFHLMGFGFVAFINFLLNNDRL